METVYDIAIVGGGPAGLSAASMALARQKKVILFESGSFGARLRKAPRIDNYLGLPGVSGQVLMDTFVQQVKEQGEVDHLFYLCKERVQNIFSGPICTIVAGTELIQAKSVIITCGASMEIPVSGEKELLGRGVSYCATCDGALFKDKTVVVYATTVDGIEDILFLASMATKVIVRTLLPAADYRLMLQKIEEANGKEAIEIENGQKLMSIEGTQKVEAVVCGGERLVTDGVFILRYTSPPQQLLEGLQLDGEYISVNRHMETSVPGIFAAGDVVGKPWQIAKAVGEGAVAALGAVAYLDSGNSED